MNEGQKTGLDCPLTDDELIEAVMTMNAELARTGAKTWRMHIPVDLRRDSDILIAEIARRFRDSRSRPCGELVTREAIGVAGWQAWIEKNSEPEGKNLEALARVFNAIYALQLAAPVAEVPSVDLSGLVRYSLISPEDDPMDTGLFPSPTGRWVRFHDLEKLLTHTRPDMGAVVDAVEKCEWNRIDFTHTWRTACDKWPTFNVPGKFCDRCGKIVDTNKERNDGHN